MDNRNPKYFSVDNLYYAGLIVIDYYREYTDIIFKSLINCNINLNFTCFYEKQDSYKTIKDLTYYIGNVGTDLSEGNKNREDIEIASYSYNDAKFIRKEMQVNNEELYFIYTYVTVYGETKEEVEYLLNKVEGILSSNGIITRRGNFRQEPIFLSCTPCMINPQEIKEVSRRNILSSSLVSTYPFVSSSICDDEGVFIGTNIYNNSMILVDRFNKDKYKNANMCIFGTSGAGKSFYVKSLVLRHRLLNISQYIIDPEREYDKVCYSLRRNFVKIRG